MNARERALDYFCDELDGYLEALIEEGMSFDEALGEAMFEYDEFWRACLQEELDKEDLTAGSGPGIM